MRLVKSDGCRDKLELYLTRMRQFSDTELLERQKCIQKQIEIAWTGHFLPSSFELSLIEVVPGRGEGQLTGSM